MHKKIKKFLKCLAGELGQAKCSRDQLKVNFSTSVKKLPASALKDELLNNVDEYFIKLESYMHNDGNDVITDGITSTENSQLQDELPSQAICLPFNLYASYAKSNVNFPSKDICRCYFSQIFDEEILETITDSVDDQLREMCNLTIRSPIKIEKLMLAFYRKISLVVEGVLEKGNKKNMKTMQKTLLRYLYFLHHSHEIRHQTTLNEEKFKYEDILSALLSLYADLACVNSRNVQTNEKPIHVEMLSTVIHFFLSHFPSFVLDVVLQMNQLTSEDISLILPLIRSVPLKAAGSLKNNEGFTKYVLSVCKISKCCDQEEQESIKETAMSIHAPKMYLDWIKEKCPTLIDELPDNTRNFKGVQITRYLLEEASEEILDVLQDLLTIQEEEVEAETAMEAEEQSLQGTSVDDNNLFFVDKSADSSNYDQDQVANRGSQLEVDEMEEEITLLGQSMDSDNEKVEDENSGEESDTSDDMQDKVTLDHPLVSHIEMIEDDQSGLTEDNTRKENPTLDQSFYSDTEVDDESDADETADDKYKGLKTKSPSSENDLEVYDLSHTGLDVDKESLDETLKADIVAETEKALTDIVSEENADKKGVNKTGVISLPSFKEIRKSKRRSMLVAPDLTVVNESQESLPRKTRRSLLHHHEESSNLSPHKPMKSRQIMSIISDSETSVTSSPVRSSPRLVRNSPRLKNKTSTKHVTKTIEHTHENLGLTLDDIKKTTRKRTISQTSVISHTSIMSEESISSNTRSRSQTATPVKTDGAPRQSLRRRSMNLSTLPSQDPKKQKGIGDDKVQSENKRLKRRSMIY